MAQVLKPEVRERIQTAALRHFAHEGYDRTTLAAVAKDAGTAPANLYRYAESKQALFAAVVPPDLAARHDALLERRIAALARGMPPSGRADGEPDERANPLRRNENSPFQDGEARDLLRFWTEHRLAVVVLLDRAEGTPFADYPARFVRRMVADVVRAAGIRPNAAQADVLELVFDNTRRAIARILRDTEDAREISDRIATFWSYQVPGLDGLIAHLTGSSTVPLTSPGAGDAVRRQSP